MNYDDLFKGLKVVGGELVIADLHLGLDLLLVAVLLSLLHALLLGHVGARQAGLLRSGNYGQYLNFEVLEG